MNDIRKIIEGIKFYLLENPKMLMDFKTSIPLAGQEIYGTELYKLSKDEDFMFEAISRHSENIILVDNPSQKLIDKALEKAPDDITSYIEEHLLNQVTCVDISKINDFSEKDLKQIKVEEVQKKEQKSKSKPFKI